MILCEACKERNRDRIRADIRKWMLKAAGFGRTRGELLAERPGSYYQNRLHIEPFDVKAESLRAFNHLKRSGAIVYDKSARQWVQS